MSQREIEINKKLLHEWFQLAKAILKLFIYLIWFDQYIEFSITRVISKVELNYIKEF